MSGRQHGLYCREVSRWLLGQPWCQMAMWRVEAGASLTLDAVGISGPYMELTDQSELAAWRERRAAA